MRVNQDEGFGYLYSEDVRDKNYPISSIIAGMPNIPKKDWWTEGWYGDQGKSSQCVAYSWTHWFEDGPIIHDALPKHPAIDPARLYRECQLRDEWEGTNYNGTSVRAGAKVLKKLGVISEYRWANSVDEMIKSISLLGPMVVGTNWYSNMTRPNSRGYCTPDGKRQGGHAYLLVGVDTHEEYFKIKNSWGKQWGDNGYSKIAFDDFEKLNRQWSQCCIAFGNKVDKVPNFDLL